MKTRIERRYTFTLPEIRKKLPELEGKLNKSYIENGQLEIFTCEYKDTNKKESEQTSKKTEQNKVKKVVEKSPPNTTLFLTWLHKKNYKVFHKEAFFRDYPRFDKVLFDKILSHQIKRNLLTQLSNNQFKVNV